MNDTFEDVVQKLADLDVQYLRLHREWREQKKTIEQLQRDIQEWEQISEKQVAHLTRNGKEIMRLTEENAKLKDALEIVESEYRKR